MTILHVLSPRYLLHSDPPYAFVCYAYKSKPYFLRIAMIDDILFLS